ncbi:hypothetical protein L6164_027454 [Bauhinia variegata]|uniref:Uncharacterized protein n=1 Tax=Bauhinia variegata TaxID=167791 RepID=A0ACB9LTE8_BAUVA|nr:hypothetical protein L6164_027454 [Bauhinia variegata]
MVYLFLSEPNWNADVDGDSVKLRISLLSELESVIWSMMMSGGRSEARLWLCSTIAGMTSITPRHQRELFVTLLRSTRQKKGLASLLVHMMFEKNPQKGGSILAKKSHILEKFFEGNPKRILQWFSSSSSGSGLDQGKGVKALSHFSFKNRDICWEELEWKGKHGQSPAVVATKPHYFLDLEIQRTVENFLENVPEFWSSDEFAESLKDGDIFFIDRQFFVQYFVDLMYKEDSRDVWEVINEFLIEQPFSSLCQRLLITLEERDLFYFLDLLRKLLNPRIEPKNFNNISYLFEIILSKSGDFGSIDQVLLLNAVITQGRQLLRLLREEEFHEAQAKIDKIGLKISEIPTGANSLTPLFKNICNMTTVEVLKCLGLQCWIFYYTMSQEFLTPKSWESVFTDNEIDFRRSDKYALLDHDGSSEGPDFDRRASVVVKSRKKRKGRKKKRRAFNHNDDELGFDVGSWKSDLLSDSASWLLSTDGYSAAWSSADLPEHLHRSAYIEFRCHSSASFHCFKHHWNVLRSMLRYKKYR